MPAMDGRRGGEDRRAEIDHVSVKQTVGQVAEHAGEQKRERKIAQENSALTKVTAFELPSGYAAEQQHQREQKRHTGDRDKERVVVFERTKRRAVFVMFTKMKKVRHHNHWPIGIDGM